LLSSKKIHPVPDCRVQRQEEVSLKLLPPFMAASIH
jgi:hypothetical protein